MVSRVNPQRACGPPTRKDAQAESDVICRRRSRRVLPMPRYYFHVRRGQATILDNRGVVLVDDVEAARDAVRRALQIEDREATHAHRSARAIIVEDGISTVFEVPVNRVLKDGIVSLQ